MWKEYSRDFIRRNRAFGSAIAAASLFAALFLSFLCCTFYNVWVYEIERIQIEEGDWHGRITGAFSPEDRDFIRNFANVESADFLPDGEGEQRAQLRFADPRRIYRDMPLLLQGLGLGQEAAEYHEYLLSRYLIHDPADDEPPLLVGFYGAVLLIVCLSLVLVIHNAFAVSMESRVRQLGALSSIGATPGQLLTCLLQEAAALCALPALGGTGLGAALGWAAMQGMNRLAGDISGRHTSVFHCPPALLAFTLLAVACTVLASAWLPARRLSRCSPLQAVRCGPQAAPRKAARPLLLPLLFGAEGALAAGALKAHKKALRTSYLSLTLSFLGFSSMLCFFTLSEISTEYTYFARYRDAWDIMVQVREADLADFAPAGGLRTLPGARDCVLYQKAEALCALPPEWQGEELRALGGPQALMGQMGRGQDGLVQSILVVLDDASFLEYCRAQGVGPSLDGSVVLNRIWNSQSSNFRYPEYIPYLTPGEKCLTLQDPTRPDSTIQVRVLGYADTPPLLREEYPDYALVQVLPLTLWRQTAATWSGREAELYVRLLAPDGAGAEQLRALASAAQDCIGDGYDFDIEDRLQEEADNQKMLDGFRWALGGVCGLLALIGLANLFAFTWGFLRQRRREFAQYLSVGLTPGGMCRLFAAEALCVAGRPLLTGLALTAAVTGCMIRASHLHPMEFWARAPFTPILLFGAAIAGAVALAYYGGGQRLLRMELAQALRREEAD